MRLGKHFVGLLAALALTAAHAPPSSPAADRKPPTSPPASRPAAGEDELFAPAGDAKRVVFIGDATGTMISKIGWLKTGLSQAVEALGPDQSFDIVFYTDGGTVQAADKQKLMPATPANKQKAADFLRTLVARGTTDPAPAIRAAFALQPQVVYFLSDGEFSNRRSYREVVDLVAKLNAGHKAVVHAVQYDTYVREAADAMRAIAAGNGGTYRIAGSSAADRAKQVKAEAAEAARAARKGPPAGRSRPARRGGRRPPGRRRFPVVRPDTRGEAGRLRRRRHRDHDPQVLVPAEGIGRVNPSAGRQDPVVRRPVLHEQRHRVGRRFGAAPTRHGRQQGQGRQVARRREGRGDDRPDPDP